jgi:predicted oxidoreductase (fatty acid repression mutant protein)
LLGKQGKHLWEYVISQLTKPISESALVKLNSCLNAYATILFYDDTKVTIQEARQRNLREEGFASWALQANAMLQHSLWLGLSYLDYAVNIQHYNTLIEIEARNKYEIPDHWQLIAQMSFGKFTKDAQKHSYLPIAEQLFIKR